MNKYFQNKKRGFTLLIAVLTASLLLSISLSIFNIALKELQISGAGRDSHIAFYAADSGIECALYWDYRDAFATSTAATITCAGQTHTVGGNTSSFTIGGGNSACADVRVIKSGGETTIESRGYNTCLSVPRRTERGIRVKY